MKEGPISPESFQRTMENVLFSTIDKVLNPAPLDTVSQTSALKCEEFASFFQHRVISIRAGIQHTKNNHYDTPEHSPPELTHFSSITEPELRKIVTQTNSSTCALDPVPSNF